MRRSVLFVALLAPAAAALAAPEKEKFKLERRLVTGARLLATETQRNENTAFWKDDGPGKLIGRVVDETTREYEQEVTSEKPLVLKRKYRSSLRTKGDLLRDKPVPLPTGAHGKTLLLASPGGATYEDGSPSDENDSVLKIERLIAACLPDREVAVGEEWKAKSDELVKAVFGPAGGAAEDTRAIGKLEKVSKEKGVRTARFALKIVIRLKAVDPRPAISLELAGKAAFALDDGILAAFELVGSAHYERKRATPTGERVEVGDGPIRFAYKAEAVEPVSAPTKAPEPPKPSDEPK